MTRVRRLLVAGLAAGLLAPVVVLGQSAAAADNGGVDGWETRRGGTMRSCSRRLAAVLPMVWLMGAPTYAQEPATHAEENRARREEKSAAAHAYEPGTFERSLKFFEEKGVFLLDREGFYPKLGSLADGSGFAYGAGFRDRDLFSDRGRLDVWAARSVRGYWAAASGSYWRAGPCRAECHRAHRR